jgi:hypothetical protein
MGDSLMATVFSALSGTGLVITPDTSGSMQFTTGVNYGNVGMSIDSTGNVTLGAITGITMTSYSSVKSLFETASVVAAAPTATVNLDMINQAVYYYTSSATNNTTINIRGSAAVALNNIVTIGQSASVTFMMTIGATGYYPNVIQIDGVTQTVKWALGLAPSSGNPNGIDIYSFSCLKTANSTWTVFGSQTRYA